jgi:hypothetical protein
MADFSSWAQRRTGRGQRPAEEPRQVQQQAAPAVLPIPPAGYAWGFQNGNYILVPLTPQQAAPAPSTFVPPPRQPSGVRPFVPQPITSQFAPGHATARVETCVLVKPADKDPYAELLAGLPDLVPEGGGYDAMAGNPSPLTIQEAGNCSEFATSQDGQAMRAFPEGAVLARGSTPLKGAGG